MLQGPGQYNLRFESRIEEEGITRALMSMQIAGSTPSDTQRSGGVTLTPQQMAVLTRRELLLARAKPGAMTDLPGEVADEANAVRDSGVCVHVCACVCVCVCSLTRGTFGTHRCD